MTQVTIDPWTFSTSSLPTDPRLMATVANGYLGTRVFGDIFHVNGLYNGTVGDCHRADVPSPLNVRLCSTKEEDVEETFSLCIKTGTFSHILRCSSYTATQQIFAHRSHNHLLANIITLKRTQGSHPVTLNLQVKMKIESPDLELQIGDDFHDAKYIYGNTLVPEVASCPRKAIHMIWNPVPQSLGLEVEQEKSWVFLTAVSDSEDDVKNKFVEGLKLINEGRLYPSHENAWAELWVESCVDIEDLLNLKQPVYGCLYYLLSSLPPLHSTEEFYGISPGGLSNGRSNEDYWGHVFWDQDTWMFPNVLLFYPEMAAHILKYRIRTLRGAEENAQQQGYKGAKYPWESALTGHEVCPEKIYGDQEIHINGDVLLAFKQYYNMTKDLDFFSSAGGWEVVTAIAEYWCSRVIWNEEEQCYHLKGVMPPDEYHTLVDNSIYTNALVQISLKFAMDLASNLSQSVPAAWKDVANKIKLPYDSIMNYHPEYDGYTIGEKVKQADAVLLGYPMMFPMTAEQRKNDLEIYEQITDIDGPAMTWSMFAVGWMELKQAQAAQDQLKKCFANITEPFKIWTENADGSGAVNFLTGMGGFLQAVLFGYTGFRITDKCLKFDLTLPDDVTRLCITGVCYLGNKLNFAFARDVMTIKLTSVRMPQSPSLDVTFGQYEPHIPLCIGKSVSFPTKAGCIQQRSSCSPL